MQSHRPRGCGPRRPNLARLNHMQDTRLLGEEVLIRYGGELDVFVEKRFGKSVSVRLSANNLLDASKDEFFDKFDTLQDQIDRDYDEYELETEEAGPSYQLVMRWAF